MLFDKVKGENLWKSQKIYLIDWENFVVYHRNINHLYTTKMFVFKRNLTKIARNSEIKFNLFRE